MIQVLTNSSSPDDKVIALMGMIGTGKSSFIQLFTDVMVGIGDDLESCKAPKDSAMCIT